MTSKCVKNNKVAHNAIEECVIVRLRTCFLILGTFLCCPLQNNNVKLANSALGEKREPTTAIVFKISISNFMYTL